MRPTVPQLVRDARAVGFLAGAASTLFAISLLALAVWAWSAMGSV